MDRELSELIREFISLEQRSAVEQLAELKTDRENHMRHIELVDERIRMREDMTSILDKISNRL